MQLLTGFGLVTGATYPLRTLGVFLRNPNLWGYLFVPILINIVVAILLYSGLLLFGWDFLGNLLDHFANQIDNLQVLLPSWLGFLDYLIIVLGWLLRLILIVVLFILTGFFLVQFGTLLGAPWYGKLSEKLEQIRTGKLDAIEVSVVRDIWRAIAFELKKIVLAISIAFALLLCNLIPGFGTIIGSVGSLTLTATIVCLDFFDAFLERRRLRFRSKLKIVWISLPASGSFSLVCLFLIGIPLLNLFTVPLCVASGTLFCCDRVLPRLSSFS